MYQTEIPLMATVLFALTAVLPVTSAQAAAEGPQQEYWVLAKDAPGVGEGLMRLATEHWDYIDKFAPPLVARGPLISADGQQHMGSVHILRAESFAAAQRFANEEPYQKANFFSQVSVMPYLNLLGKTMWEIAPATQPGYSTFLHASWSGKTCDAQQLAQLKRFAAGQTDWIFLGLLFAPDGQCVGMSAAMDLQPEAAEQSLRALFSHAGLKADLVESSRWRRGGRPRQ